MGFVRGRLRRLRVTERAVSWCGDCAPRKDCSCAGSPERWLRISSTVICAVYVGSARMKSSGRSWETGVVHWTAGYAGSSTRRATAAAVKDLDVLATSKRVSEVHGLPSSWAWPKFWARWSDWGTVNWWRGRGLL
jgi:hypothetical protein